MGKLSDCLEAARATGKLDPDQIAIILKRVSNIEGRLKKDGALSPEQAILVAEKQALDSTLEQLALEKRQKVLQVLTLARNINDVKAHPKSVGVGVMSKLVRDLKGEAPWSNVDNRSKVILGQAHTRFAEAMSAYRTKNLGFSQNKEGVRNMVRELFGEGSKDPDAKAFAGMWSDVAEFLRQRFNKAGGHIAKREDWGLPQYHDPVRVKRMGREPWKRFISERVDWDKMREQMGPDVDLDDIGKIMDQAYDRIVTEGLVDMMPGRVGGTKLANRRTDPRFFIFKDADSWLSYHDAAGHTDVYTTLTDHIARMSNETALLEVMGPNPEAAFRYLSDLALKDGYSGSRMAMLDNVWDVVSGKVNASQSVRLADFGASVRHLNVAAKLGGAFLSSISDLAFQRITRKFNGIPGVVGMKNILRQMDPTKEADRLFAVKLGLTAEAWNNRALAANRFTEVTGAGFAAKISDAVMRASLLSSWTDGGRKAFGMEFLSYMAEMKGRQWGALRKELRNAFKRYGITKEDWDAIRATKTLNFKGVEFMQPEAIMKNTDLTESTRTDLATKFMEMILTETDFAVPTPDARVRAISTLGTKRGTFIGEVTRSAFMFKSFPITVISTHMMRGALQNGLANKGRYLSSIMISTTVLGAIAMQAKDIARGRDPRNMDDPKFWGAAMLQGGGAGIFGDFLFSDVNRFGRGPIMTLAGPVAEMGEATLKLTVGNLQQALADDDPQVARDLIRYMRNYTPGGSLWYTRIAFERLFIDQLDQMADKGKARKSWQRIQRRRQKEYGQGAWWKPGQLTPSRAPRYEGNP